MGWLLFTTLHLYRSRSLSLLLSQWRYCRHDCRCYCYCCCRHRRAHRRWSLSKRCFCFHRDLTAKRDSKAQTILASLFFQLYFVCRHTNALTNIILLYTICSHTCLTLACTTVHSTHTHTSGIYNILPLDISSSLVVYVFLFVRLFLAEFCLLCAKLTPLLALPHTHTHTQPHIHCWTSGGFFRHVCCCVSV